VLLCLFCNRSELQYFGGGWGLLNEDVWKEMSLGGGGVGRSLNWYRFVDYRVVAYDAIQYSRISPTFRMFRDEDMLTKQQAVAHSLHATRRNYPV
jgi:hypothetical protein